LTIFDRENIYSWNVDVTVQNPSKWTTLSFPPPPLPRVYEKFSKVNMQDENSNSQLERREKNPPACQYFK